MRQREEKRPVCPRALFLPFATLRLCAFALDYFADDVATEVTQWFDAATNLRRLLRLAARREIGNLADC